MLPSYWLIITTLSSYWLVSTIPAEEDKWDKVGVGEGGAAPLLGVHYFTAGLVVPVHAHHDYVIHVPPGGGGGGGVGRTKLENMESFIKVDIVSFVG